MSRSLCGAIPSPTRCVMDVYGFICLNNGDSTFRLNDRQASAIDVTFGKNLGMLPLWKVLDTKLTNSNHMPIIFEFEGSTGTVNSTTRICHSGVLEEISRMEVGDSIVGFHINVHNIIANNTIRIEPDNRYSPKAGWCTEVQLLFSD